MNGHVRKRGNLWQVVLDLGEQDAQRCPACMARRGRTGGRLLWVEKGGRLDSCPQCGAALENVRARRQLFPEDRYRLKTEAQNALTRQLNADLTGTFVEPEDLTVAHYFEHDWLPTLEGAPATLTAYKLRASYIVKHLGERRLQRLTTKDVDRFYATLRTETSTRGKVLSPATRRAVHFVLRRGLQDAVRWKLIPANPAADAQRPKLQRRVMKTWTAEQLGVFLDATAQDREGPLWALYALTGMRRGEALALRLQDMNLDAGRLHLQRNRTKAGYTAIERELKGHKGRPLSIGPRAVAVLRRQLAQQLEEAQELGGAWKGDGHVFTQASGEPYHPDRVYQLFLKAVERVGLPSIRIHDLRHTHATLALQAGVNPKVVQERLGHESIRQTMDTYSHVLEVLHEAAAELIENLVPVGAVLEPADPFAEDGQA